MAYLELTPQRLPEIVLLGMYWQHWPPKLHHSPRGTPYHRTCATTVDHVLGTLQRLDVIHESMVKFIRHKTNGLAHQRTLKRHCGVAYGSNYATDIYSWFLCQQSSSSSQINLQRLVRDQRLVIIAEGAEKAPEFEAKYKDAISKEAYLEEVERFDALFKNDRASAAVNKQYRRRVEEELGK